MLLAYEHAIYDLEDQLDDLIDDVLDNLNEVDLADLWNEFCEENNYVDDHVFSMSELEDYLELRGVTAYEVLTKNVVDSDCFCAFEEWFVDSTWGLRSSDSIWDLVDLDQGDFRAYFEEKLLDNPEKYGCKEISEE